MRATEIVVAFVTRPDGRILVQPRLGERGSFGVWELPGGKVGAGESQAAALAREVREETGLEVEVGELVCALCHGYADRRVALHAYRCTPLDHRARVDPDAGDGMRARALWVTSGQYRRLAMPTANPPLLDALDWSLRKLVRPRTIRE